MTQPHDPDPERDWGGPTAWQQPQPQPPQYQQPPAAPPGPPPPPYSGYQAPPPWTQQPQWQPGPMAQPPKTYLVPAILVTLLCFLPTGVAAIVFASRVSSKLAIGDYAGAHEASRQARLWVIVSVAVGVVLGLIILAGSGSSSSGF